MSYKALMAFGLSLLLTGVCSAQTVYEPVASQYRVGDRTFYYGGSDPRAVAYATRAVAGVGVGRSSREGRTGVAYLRSGLIGRPPEYVVSDALPLRNAVVYGYTSVDARNDAAASVPTFFRGSDLAAAAVPSPDGIGKVVPAQAVGAIDVRPWRGSPNKAPAPQTTLPATQPKPVLIIPKSLLSPSGGVDQGVVLAR